MLQQLAVHAIEPKFGRRLIGKVYHITYYSRNMGDVEVINPRGRMLTVPGATERFKVSSNGGLIERTRCGYSF